jgi:hypothetical protein
LSEIFTLAVSLREAKYLLTSYGLPDVSMSNKFYSQRVREARLKLSRGGTPKSMMKRSTPMANMSVGAVKYSLSENISGEL